VLALRRQLHAADEASLPGEPGRLRGRERPCRSARQPSSAGDEERSLQGSTATATP
jgi:hypothetical protein